MPTIILTRHGQTRANLENRFAGRADVGLTPEGVAQITALADRLASLSPATVVCGPAARTRESATIIAARCKIPLRVMDEFDEIYLPHWDGLTKDEIRNRFGDEYPTWLSAPHRFRVEGCETIARVQERALAGINRILRHNPGGDVVLVTHLIVVRALLTAAAGKGLDAFRSFKMANGEIVRLREEEGKIRFAEPA